MQSWSNSLFSGWMAVRPAPPEAQAVDIGAHGMAEARQADGPPDMAVALAPLWITAARLARDRQARQHVAAIDVAGDADAARKGFGEGAVAKPRARKGMDALRLQQRRGQGGERRAHRMAGQHQLPRRAAQLALDGGEDLPERLVIAFMDATLAAPRDEIRREVAAITPRRPPAEPAAAKGDDRDAAALPDPGEMIAARNRRIAVAEAGGERRSRRLIGKTRAKGGIERAHTSSLLRLWPTFPASRLDRKSVV